MIVKMLEAEGNNTEKKQQQQQQSGSGSGDPWGDGGDDYDDEEEDAWSTPAPAVSHPEPRRGAQVSEALKQQQPVKDRSVTNATIVVSGGTWYKVLCPVSLWYMKMYGFISFPPPGEITP